MKKFLFALLFAFTLFNAGCQGCSREFSSWRATSFGSDWIVVQYQFDGQPMNCYQLHSTSISNEQGTDGIYWKDATRGHLVHLSGWYNRVQVAGGDFKSAAKMLGVDADKCNNGKY